MRKKAGTLLMAIGVITLAFAVFQYFEQRVQMRQALAKAEALVESASPEAISVEKPSASPAASPDYLASKTPFSPKENEAVGILQIPKIKAKLPIIEGTDEEMLEQGVGHYAASAFPSEGEQIVLSGHRDTVFRNFGKLEIGDHLTVEMPYGSFEYEIAGTKIVDKDDTSIIHATGEEVLVLTTCYPFRYIGNAPQRYIIYAYPVTDENIRQTGES